jgi:hypothetical protein
MICVSFLCARVSDVRKIRQMAHIKWESAHLAGIFLHENTQEN